jgi:hypothetical protein
LSAKTVAQKPRGNVIPPLSPAQAPPDDPGALCPAEASTGELTASSIPTGENRMAMATAALRPGRRGLMDHSSFRARDRSE